MQSETFAALHDSSDPLVLFNIWDAGSALAVARAGARAIATGSWSVAGAQGYADGEAMPFEDLLRTVRQIARVIEVPLTVDIETGFAASLEQLVGNGAQLRSAGAVGCNLEDQLIGQSALRDVDEQCERIGKLAGAGLFVNARTDIFLKQLIAGKDANRAELVDEAVERAAAYRAAGSGCFFVPGLSDPELIGTLCERVDLPVNVMWKDGVASNAELARLGVSRISHGPGPWRSAMKFVRGEAREALEH